MSERHAREKKQAAFRAVTGGGVLLLVCVALIFGAIQYVDSERVRDEQAWQVRLGVVADSRRAAVDDWIDRQFERVSGLAANGSLQLYMMSLATMGDLPDDMPADVVAAEEQYLENLLILTAEQGGFMPDTETSAVNANIGSASPVGLALLDANAEMLVYTPGMGAPDAAIFAAIEDARATGQGFINVRDTEGTITIGFVAAIRSIQGGPRDISGYVVGIRKPDDAFYAALVQPGDVNQTGLTYLIDQQSGVIRYLTPLVDGTGALELELATDSENLVAAHALREPGGFYRALRYDNQEVLATSRALGSAPWTLIRSVDVAEALAPLDTRRRNILTILILMIAGIAVAAIAVWRHGASVRVAAANAELSTTRDELAASNRLLAAVTDSHPAKVLALASNGRTVFANKAAVDATGMSQQEALGKTLPAILGTDFADQLEGPTQQVLGGGSATEDLIRHRSGDRDIVYQSHYVPLAMEANEKGVLLLIDDVTAAVTDRERREGLLRSLMTTLVALLDQKDPFSSHHSARVAEVAVAVANAMEGEDTLVRACDLAGNLVNIGKFFVPAELLTKQGKLTDEEREVLRASVIKGADLVSDLAWDVPVTETLKDLQERWDGSGYPAGKSGEDIERSARIIAVANAFVGMVSRRAYRDPMSFDVALNELSTMAGTAFDRKAVFALAHAVENLDGRNNWKHFSEDA